MGDKILVEFNKEDLKERCKKYCVLADRCGDDYDLINCIIDEEVKFKIKEQSNGNKGTED